ncbi:MAG: hypothetical protein KOO62_13650 [candidate division Zixibacteria bacterium]|nr:hypothetical protein [candidate division Zixibacteria bacterium]
MTFSEALRRVTVISVTALSLILLTIPTASAQPELVITVGDTIAAPGTINTVISVSLDNYHDTVAGFNLWLQLGNPDIMSFQTNEATVIDTSYWDCITYSGEDCIDSVLTNPLGDWDFIHIDTNDVQIGSFDTTGTLVGGWQNVAARSLSGTGLDLNIVGIARMPFQPELPGIPPGNHGETPLIKLLADVYDIPDTATDRTVQIMVQWQFIDHFSWSRPDGSLIGIVYDTILDTNYFLCTQWAGSECLKWEKVPSPPADSIEINEILAPRVDTLTVIIDNGSLTVSGSSFCGNIDGDDSPEPNIADLTYLVSFLFIGGPPPEPLWVADLDCTGGEPNIGDLTYLVAFLFTGGVAPCDVEACW